MISADGAAVGLAGLSERYAGVLCDIWGVVHNGIRFHPAAVDALMRFRSAGGKVMLITNAARPAMVIEAMLDEMGVPRAIYDGIISSGDMTRALVAPYSGQAVHHVGPATDLPMFEGIDVTFTGDDDAAVVVVTGLNDPSETPDDYSERLRRWLERGLVFICANPDKLVEVGDRMVYCPGALADIYESMGGTVLQAGKPHPAIYAETVAQLNQIAGRQLGPGELLAIGDSVRTDAAGAAAAGIDFLFITGSIHAGEMGDFDAPDPGAVARLVAPSGARMVGFMPRLAWEGRGAT